MQSDTMPLNTLMIFECLFFVGEGEHQRSPETGS